MFVGPNNSGKSRALREIERWCWGEAETRLILDSIEADIPDDPSQAETLLRAVEVQPQPSETVAPGHFLVGYHTFRGDSTARSFQVATAFIEEWAARRDPQLTNLLLSTYTVRLDARTRFLLVDPKPTGDLQAHPQNHLWALFQADSARERVRSMTAEAFGLYFVIDPTAMNTFRIRMSRRPPASKQEEQGLDENARLFHRDAPLITELGDGVQAFTGLVSAVLSLPHKVILIDEPEAFLHPPLARRLGGNLALLARERDASLAVSTHSAEFVMGCVEAEEDATIIRLTYENSNATARVLDSAMLKPLMRDALIRSTGVLRALFHRAAVVSESEADRAFYDEMNRRLQPAGRGIADTLFLNAQNKQTIGRLVGPLRRIGIPAAALVDLDIIEDKGDAWKHLREACQVDPADMENLRAERTYLKHAFDQVPRRDKEPKPLKARGLDALPPGDKERGEAFLRRLATYGLFAVPCGELESWLPAVRAGGHGTTWLMDLFKLIGQEGTDPDYLRPGVDDIWKFLDDIAAWVNDPNRKGTSP